MQVEGIGRAVQAGYEHHRDVEACGDFILSEAQLRAFLREARIIDGRTASHEFNWAPCLVRATLRWPGEAAGLEVSAFLLGELRLAGGQVVLLGCDGACKAAVDALR